VRTQKSWWAAISGRHLRWDCGPRSAVAIFPVRCARVGMRSEQAVTRVVSITSLRVASTVVAFASSPRTAGYGCDPAKPADVRMLHDEIDEYLQQR
jgi:hypothetical protein